MKLILVLILVTLASQGLTKKSRNEGAFQETDPLIYPLFMELFKLHQDENLVYSPASIQLSLGLAELGSKGATSDEIKSIIGPENSFFNDDDKGLQIANKAFVRKEYKIKDEYKAAIEKLRSEVEGIDFENTEEAAVKISSWIQDHTDRRITNIVEPDKLDKDLSVVLVNAAKFKGSWTTPFESTAAMPFTNIDGSTIEVPMMKRSANTPYLEYNDTRIVLLEYADSEFSMLILIPKTDDTETLRRQCKQTEIQKITRLLQNPKPSSLVDITMPQFEFEFNVDLKDPLTNLGMKLSWTDDADFSGMVSNAADADVPVKISDVIHKTYINVNKDGTDAVAAKGVHLLPKTKLREDPASIDFTVDRPFLFMLLNKDKFNLPLIVGVVNNFEKF